MTKTPQPLSTISSSLRHRRFFFFFPVIDSLILLLYIDSVPVLSIIRKYEESRLRLLLSSYCCATAHCVPIIHWSVTDRPLPAAGQTKSKLTSQCEFVSPPPYATTFPVMTMVYFPFHKEKLIQLVIGQVENCIGYVMNAHARRSYVSLVRALVSIQSDSQGRTGARLILLSFVKVPASFSVIYVIIHQGLN